MKRKLLACAFLSTFVIVGCSSDNNATTSTSAGPGTGGSGGSGGSSGSGGGGTGGSTGGADGGDAGAMTATQATIDAIASQTQVGFAVIENVPMIDTDAGMMADCPASTGGFCLDAKITLKNTGPAWNAQGWAIYFSMIRKVAWVGNSDFTITHVAGDLHKLEPTATFSGFAASETKEIPIKAQFWMMAETDIMPRWYVTAPMLTPKVITNTDTEDLATFVAPFADRKSQQRHPADQSVIETAATRFAENTAATWPAANVASEIVPSPQTVMAGTGTLDLSTGVTITLATATDVNADGLTALKTRMTNLGLTVKDTGGVPIKVSVNPNDSAFVSKPTAEAYVLQVDGTGVTIVGGDSAGAYYGLQTLVSLLPGDLSASKTIPQLKVDYDAPRYSYRGAQMDLSRNFHNAAEVMKVLDQMSAYKLNALHLHLSDDEGWRLEIPGLAELTSVGSKRCHDLTEKTCLLPQLGSGPDSTSSGSGFLARADFVNILKAATARYIEVIPEFDMPGHARAAIKSMEAKGDMAYLLSDPMDKSMYESVQYYTDGAVNACLDSTYTFIGTLMDAVKSMYTDAGATLKTWHIGADEVGAGAWTDSPACKALYASGGAVKSADDVHEYFIKKVNGLAKAKGFAVRGWSDGLRKNVAVGDAGMTEKQFLDPVADLDSNPVSVNWWGTLFWWDYHNSAYTAANKGFKVILTSPDFLYLDHPHEADPKERGYYWATRFTSVRKLFGYISGNLPANSKLTKDRMGGDYQAVFDPTMTDPTPPVSLDAAAAANIVGMEGAQWGETMRTDDELEGMMFPRLLAMAERAWHRAAWEPADVSGTDWGKATPIDTAGLGTDWERFANVLAQKELRKLDKLGVKYRIEVPGASIDTTGVLKMNVALPGLALEYQDGTNWVAYNPASPPTLTATSTQVHAKSADGMRIGRAIPVSK
jgi:hexosaminidase